MLLFHWIGPNLSTIHSAQEPKLHDAAIAKHHVTGGSRQTTVLNVKGSLPSFHCLPPDW